MSTTTAANSTPGTTLGWERGRIFHATAWRLEDTDVIAQREQDGWSIYLEHEIYGPEWVDGVDSWQDVLVWVNSQLQTALICGNFG